MPKKGGKGKSSSEGLWIASLSWLVEPSGIERTLSICFVTIPGCFPGGQGGIICAFCVRSYCSSFGRLSCPPLRTPYPPFRHCHRRNGLTRVQAVWRQGEICTHGCG